MSPRTNPSVVYAVSKRLTDIVGSLLLIIILSPVLLAIAGVLAIDGPKHIIFRQRRTGRDGRTFPMLKFRTMVTNAEELKASLAHLNVLEPPDFKIIDDPRITRFGRFLRKTSLDELPQLFNVLVGHMSLVGPRPTSFGASTYDLWHTSRLEVRPGITGPWQVLGRHTMSFDERLRLDLSYVERQSLAYDLRMLTLTIGAVARRSGA